MNRFNPQIPAAAPLSQPTLGFGPIPSMPLLRSPHILDSTAHAERLREQGAYPERAFGRWRADAQSLKHVMEGYFDRSKPMISAGSDSSSKVDFFLTNERGYTSAIGSIKDNGGAFVGVGRCVPVTYAAWQNASHAYVVDRKAAIPLGFTPIYGAWLCMAGSRIEFLSLILGRPLQRTINAEGFSAEDIVDIVQSMPFDASFARSVVSAIASTFTISARTSGVHSLKGVLMEWMAKLDKAFYRHRRSTGEEMNPAAALMRHDPQGRGGALSSDASFMRQRDVFLEGRITGVSGDMIEGGLDIVEADMRRRGERLGALYISNIEDLLLFNYLFDERKPDVYTRVLRVQRYYDFYRRIAAVPDAEDAFVISAKKRRVTSVDRVARYVRRSIPLELGVDQATNAAKDFYRLRVDVEFLKGFPLMERLERISKSCRSRHRFNIALSVLRSIFRGSAVNREAFEARLAKEFDRKGLERSGWWERMFVENLEELGLVTRRLSPS
ncbi:MAG: hypothetical protein JXA24_07870 [Proteobacteria bacterium]|nr:hypothetical protein [Pseudomonadota bacterium]